MLCAMKSFRFSGCVSVGKALRGLLFCLERFDYRVTEAVDVTKHRV